MEALLSQPDYPGQGDWPWTLQAIYSSQSSLPIAFGGYLRRVVSPRWRVLEYRATVETEDPPRLHNSTVRRVLQSTGPAIFLSPTLATGVSGKSRRRVSSPRSPATELPADAAIRWRPSRSVPT